MKTIKGNIKNLHYYQAAMLVFCFILLGFTNLCAQDTKSDRIQDKPVYETPLNSTNDSGTVFTYVQLMPQFSEDIDKYLRDSIRYPDNAKKKNIQGTVYIEALIEKNGSISRVEVLRSPDTTFNNEAKRVVSTMPRWTPGKQNGVPVRVNYLIPVHFKL
jgi:periplasmic protein TonB